MSQEIDLTNLLPLACPEATARIASSHGPKPDKIVAGMLGSLRFVVSIDADGQCEVSLSCDRHLPTSAQTEAFFRKWGIPFPQEAPFRILRGRGVMWVYRRGVRH